MNGPETPAGGGRICIIGNLNVDLIIRGITQPPVWGQEIAGDDYIVVTSGQAGYLALALAHLGAPVSVIGNVGADHFGRLILHDLGAAGVDVGAVEILAGRKTGITVGLVREDGERALVSDFAHLRHFDEALVLRHWSQVERSQIVCLVGPFCLPSLPLDAAGRLLARARQEGKITVLDTGWDPANWPPDTVRGIQELLRHVSVFMPNHEEARAITGADAVEDAAPALQRLGPDLVVIKRGPQGSYARHGAATYALPSLPAQVYDTVGAGDTFDAGFLYGYRQGWEIAACLAYGSATASLYISRPADRFPDRPAVEAATSQYGIALPPGTAGR